MMLDKLVKIFGLALTFTIAGCGGGSESFAGIDAGGTANASGCRFKRHDQRIR